MGSKDQRIIDITPIAGLVPSFASFTLSYRVVQLDPKFLRNQRWAKKFNKKHSKAAKKVSLIME